MLYLTQIRSAVLLVLLAAVCGGMMAQNAPLDPFGADSSYYQGLRDFNYFDQRGGIQNRGDSPPVYIDDSRAPGTVVHVDESMYYAIKNWLMQGQNQQVPLTQALLQQFDTAAVNEFNLMFQNGDSTYFLSPGGNGGVGSRSPVGGCECKYVTFTGGTQQYGALNVSPANPTALQPYYKEEYAWGVRGYFESERKAFGAGRADYSHLHTKLGKTETTNTSSNSLDSRVSMRLLYTCVDDQELPSNCGCQKRVEVQGEFRGDLYAGAGGKRNRRDQLAQAEAYAVLSEYSVKENFEALEFPAVNRGIASATSKMDHSEEYKALAGDVATIFVNSQGDLSNASIADISIQNLTNYLLSYGPTTESGEGVDYEDVDLLFDTKPWIEPGEEKVWLLGSVTHLHNYSKTSEISLSSGHSYAAFSSTYNMHLTVPYNNSNPGCCISRFGMWSYGGYNMDFESVGLGQVKDIIFNDNVSLGDLSTMKSTLNNNFNPSSAPAWDNFDLDEYYGMTTSSSNSCSCPVSANLFKVNDDCDNVIVDITGTNFANWHTMYVWEIDDQGNWAGNQWHGGFASWPSNQIDLTSSNTPLKHPVTGVPTAYPFQAGKRYKITLGVSGYCTDWTAKSVIIEPEPDAEIAFDVRGESCDDVSIQLTNTTGADKFFFAVIQLDENNNWVSGTYKSSVGYQTASSWGWIPGPLPSTHIDFTDPSSSLLGIGAYPHFEAGERYLIQVAVKSQCSGWVDAYAIIEIEHDVFPEFDLDVSCNQVLFDGTASFGVSSFEISIIQVSEFGVPYPATEYTIQGQGAVGSYNLGNTYPSGFVSGNRYRITLTAEGANCPGRESVSQDFTYSVNPMPVIEGELSVCEDEEYFINVGNSAGVEGYKIEVFPSNPFGVPTGTSTFISGSPTQWVSIPNPVVQIHPSPYLFTGGGHYGIRLYGRNSCVTGQEVDLIVVEVKPSSLCDMKIDSEDPICEADFDINPTQATLTGGTEVEFIGKSEYTALNTIRQWTFGDGTTALDGNSPKHTYAQGGTYNVTLTISDGFGCQDHVTKTVSIQGQGGRSRIGQAGSGIKIAPNPNNGRFNISYNLENDATCKLVTVTGKVVMILEVDANAKSLDVSTKDLPAGLYFVQITQKSAVISTQKVLIQH